MLQKFHKTKFTRFVITSYQTNKLMTARTNKKFETKLAYKNYKNLRMEDLCVPNKSISTMDFEICEA